MIDYRLIFSNHLLQQIYIFRARKFFKENVEIYVMYQKIMCYEIFQIDLTNKFNLISKNYRIYLRIDDIEF